MYSRRNSVSQAIAASVAGLLGVTSRACSSFATGARGVIGPTRARG